MFASLETSPICTGHNMQLDPNLLKRRGLVSSIGIWNYRHLLDGNQTINLLHVRLSQEKRREDGKIDAFQGAVG